MKTRQLYLRLAVGSLLSLATAPALMGGELDSSFAPRGSVRPQVQAGKLFALAVAAPRRSALLPNVPTFTESAVKGYSADAGYGGPRTRPQGRMSTPCSC